MYQPLERATGTLKAKIRGSQNRIGELYQEGSSRLFFPKNFSKIAIIEYNPYFGYKESISVPNIKNFQRSKYHHSMLCFGMSIRAAINLMAKKNLVFIGSNLKTFLRLFLD